MGFSLVGPSGNTSQTVNTYNLSADINPQLDFEGASGGVLGINISPLAQNGSVGEIDPSIYDYYAPVDIVATGNAQGDSALSALEAASTAQTASQGSDPTVALAATTGSTGTVSTLFSGNSIYWILGAIVIFFLAEG